MGRPSTNQEALEPLVARHPFPGLVIEYRRLVDLRADLEALQRYAVTVRGSNFLWLWFAGYSRPPPRVGSGERRAAHLGAV